MIGKTILHLPREIEDWKNSVLITFWLFHMFIYYYYLVSYRLNKIYQLN